MVTPQVRDTVLAQFKDEIVFDVSRVSSVLESLSRADLKYEETRFPGERRMRTRTITCVLNGLEYVVRSVYSEPQGTRSGEWQYVPVINVERICSRDILERKTLDFYVLLTLKWLMTTGVSLPWEVFTVSSDF